MNNKISNKYGKVGFECEYDIQFKFND